MLFSTDLLVMGLLIFTLSHGQHYDINYYTEPCKAQVLTSEGALIYNPSWSEDSHYMESQLQQALVVLLVCLELVCLGDLLTRPYLLCYYLPSTWRDYLPDLVTLELLLLCLTLRLAA